MNALRETFTHQCAEEPHATFSSKDKLLNCWILSGTFTVYTILYQGYFSLKVFTSIIIVVRFKMRKSYV